MNRIVVVDDEPLVRKALVQTLEGAGFRARAYPSAELCLESLREEPCELVISDVSMPGFDGIWLLKELKAHFPQTRVLMMSGFADIPTAVESVKMGAVDFVEKPFDEDDILPKVRSILESYANKAETEFSDIERKILSAMASGQSTKQIAYSLEKSTRTIENYRQRIAKKLGASNSSEAVVIATKKGIV